MAAARMSIRDASFFGGIDAEAMPKDIFATARGHTIAGLVSLLGIGKWGANGVEWEGRE
ncbi:hypothetical protein [Hyphomicrobium sp.]|uniref:hypothetical protein n=1 Tax=Hyphomicrobium sp. TaxID=82 RepID=UPI003F70DAA1